MTQPNLAGSSFVCHFKKLVTALLTDFNVGVTYISALKIFIGESISDKVNGVGLHFSSKIGTCFLFKSAIYKMYIIMYNVINNNRSLYSQENCHGKNFSRYLE